MSEDMNARVNELEVKVGKVENSITNIEKGIDNQRKDMTRIFDGQEATRMAVVTGINDLGKSLPCKEHDLKIGALEKGKNGADKRLKDIEKAVGAEEKVTEQKKGWVQALDYLFKAAMTIVMALLAYLALKR